MNNPNIDPQTALNNLYNAARLAPLNAEAHEVVVKSTIALQDFITPRPENNSKVVEAEISKKKK